MDSLLYLDQSDPNSMDRIRSLFYESSPNKSEDQPYHYLPEDPEYPLGKILWKEEPGPRGPFERPV